MAFAGSKTEMHWRPESSAAWREATESARPVLVEVWAYWCQPCKRMDEEVWADARVIEAAKKFVQISVDVSSRDQTQVGGITLGNYGIHIVRAVPTVILLDPWGETLFVHEGFVHRAEMAAALAQIPADYSAVRAQREALLSHRDNSRTLASVGLLYQRNSAFGIANRYFKEALSGSGAKEDERQREQLMFRNRRQRSPPRGLEGCAQAPRRVPSCIPRFGAPGPSVVRICGRRCPAEQNQGRPTARRRAALSVPKLSDGRRGEPSTRGAPR